MSTRNSEGPSLTERERAVLAASVTGLGVFEVADLLGESPEAVRHALASAITKLGTRSKLEALVVAINRGIIDIPGSGGRSYSPR